MRIAALADIHGNLPALRAVLGDLDRDQVDAIVVPGDVVGGPLVRECLELLRGRPEPAHWISGNSEREAVAAYDGAPQADDPPGRAASWSARALDREWRDQLASWPIALELDGVLFCHGSPRRDDEILTSVTPEDEFREVLADVSQRLVVGGHTHRQFVRQVRGDLRYANAGSVGLPYEGRPGAFWMLVEDGEPRPRRTDYDVHAAADELRVSGFDIDEHLKESLLEPADPDWVAEFFERGAGRGPGAG
jgi:predicted phosphodiesterase